MQDEACIENFKQRGPIYAALLMASSNAPDDRLRGRERIASRGMAILGQTCPELLGAHLCSRRETVLFSIFLTPCFGLTAQSAPLALHDVHKRLLILI